MFKKFLHRKAEIAKSTDPERIYVENVRSFFNVPTRVAKLICNIAVRNGVLRKKYAVECKNVDCQRIIKTYNSELDLPAKTHCRTCELEGESEFEFNTSDLNIVEFYQYINNDNKK